METEGRGGGSLIDPWSIHENLSVREGRCCTPQLLPRDGLGRQRGNCNCLQLRCIHSVAREQHFLDRMSSCACIKAPHCSQRSSFVLFSACTPNRVYRQSVIFSDLLAPSTHFHFTSPISLTAQAQASFHH